MHTIYPYVILTITIKDIHLPILKLYLVSDLTLATFSIIMSSVVLLTFHKTWKTNWHLQSQYKLQHI